MAVLSAVEKALAGDPGEAWQREVALALAGEMDEKPNASIAKELRAVMGDLGVAVPEQKGDVADDLADRRAARRQAAG